MARLSRVVLVCACLLAPAAPVLAGFEAGPWGEWFEGYTMSVARTEAVAIAPGGDVYMAGLVGSPDGGDVELYRVRPDLGSMVWKAHVDMFASKNYPLGMIAAEDGSAIICGGNADQVGVSSSGFLFQVSPEGGLGWIQSRSTFYGGIRDMAMEYSTNSVVAVYANSVYSRLDGLNPATGSPKFSVEYSGPNGNGCRAYAVACDSGGTYVGGAAYFSGTYNSWIMKVKPDDKGKIYWNTYLDNVWAVSSDLSSCVLSIAARGDYVYALAFRKIGAAAIDYVVYKIDPGNGAPVAEKVIATTTSVPVEPDLTDAGQIVMHPTMPVLFVSIGKPYRVVILDQYLHELNSLVLPEYPMQPLALAVSDGLYFSLFVGSAGPDPSWTYVANKIWKTSFLDVPERKDDLVVAPNLLDRSVPGSCVNAGVTGDPAGGPFEVQVFDSAGKFVTAVIGTWTAEGKGNAKWDGTRNGIPVAPGLYYIYYKEKSLKKPVMVVNKRVKK